MERFGDLIAKKRRLGVDAWGSTHAELPEVIEPLHALIAREFPDWAPYPWGVREATDLLVRHILLAQAMLPEYAERFRGLGDDELDELAVGSDPQPDGSDADGRRIGSLRSRTGH